MALKVKWPLQLRHEQTYLPKEAGVNRQPWTGFEPINPAVCSSDLSSNWAINPTPWWIKENCLKYFPSFLATEWIQKWRTIARMQGKRCVTRIMTDWNRGGFNPPPPFFFSLYLKSFCDQPPFNGLTFWSQILPECCKQHLFRIDGISIFLRRGAGEVGALLLEFRRRPIFWNFWIRP